MPTANQVIREAVTVVAGAVLAAAVIGAMPGLREWIKKQWAGAPH